MEKIEKIINELIVISDNEKRIELYMTFKTLLDYQTLREREEEKKNILRNISGIIARSELEKKEYNLLISLYSLIEVS